MLGFDSISEHAISEIDDGDPLADLFLTVLKVTVCGDYQPGVSVCADYQPGVSRSDER